MSNSLTLLLTCAFTLLVGGNDTTAWADDIDDVKARFGKTYALNEDEVLRWFPPPFPEVRQEYLQTVRLDPRQLSSLGIRWTDNEYLVWSLSFGGKNGGFQLKRLIEELEVANGPRIEADAFLLSREVPGDFAYRLGSPSEQSLLAISMLIHKAWDMELKLEFRNVERDVIVATGKWDSVSFNPADPTIHLYGDEITPGGFGGGSGEFRDFHKSLEYWINLPVVDELDSHPADRIGWSYHVTEPYGAEQQKLAHDPLRVTTNLSLQTGIKFKKERRVIPVLHVTRLDEPPK